MIKQFNKLTGQETALLYKAPVLVSVLASSTFKEVNEDQKADAIRLSHLRTFTSGPDLREYYEEVDKQFKDQFEATVKEYFPFDESKRNALKEEIERINLIIGKLEGVFGQALHKSLAGYADHVKKAAHSVFQDFIFPMPIPGLSA